MSSDNGKQNGCGGRVLYCRCAYAQVVPEDVKRDVLAGLAASGKPFEAVSDLCEMSARRDPRLKELAAAKGLKIAACYDRAVRGLFEAAGHKLADETQVLNMRSDCADTILGRVSGRVAAAGNNGHSSSGGGDEGVAS